MAITHKKNDSLAYLAVLPNTFADGFFVGWTVKSQIRTAQYGTLIADLTCTWVDPLTTRAINVTAVDTSTWPIGSAVMDVRFVRTVDGYTISTDTVEVDILKCVTTVTEG